MNTVSCQQPSVYRNYSITDHCRQRYVERLGPKANQFKHLKKCNRGCDKCMSLLFKIRRETTENRAAINATLQARLKKSPALSVDAESEVMETMQRKYPGKTLLFLHDADCVFVIVMTTTERIVVTCYESYDSIFTSLINTPVLIPMDLLTLDLKECVDRSLRPFKKVTA